MTRYSILIFAMALVFIHCSTPKKAVGTSAKTSSESMISYAKDVKPIMIKHCTPCHFPETGQKKMLDTYAATRDNIADIVARVQLSQEDIKFMPFKLKKEPLSDSLILILRTWGKTGFAE